MRKYISLLIKYLIILDYFTNKFIKKYILKTQYKLDGNCTHCGLCCETIAVVIPNNLHRNPVLTKLVIRFYEWINNFKYLEYFEENNVLLFTCDNYDKNNTSCRHYKTRPAMCRNYPAAPYFQKPQLLPGCGYSTKLNKDQMP